MVMGEKAWLNIVRINFYQYRSNFKLARLDLFKKIHKYSNLDRLKKRNCYYLLQMMRVYSM